MVIKIFRKCGVTLVLFPLILALLSMTGCIEEKMHLLYASPPGEMDPQSIEWSGQLSMEIDPRLTSDLFYVRGSVALTGNGTLPYILLNATLSQDQAASLSTKYLLMQLEPERDYSFEIARNVRLQAGSYICTVEASGPGGLLAAESRRCTLEPSIPDAPPPASSISQPGAGEALFSGSLPEPSQYAPHESIDGEEVSLREVREKREKRTEARLQYLPAEEILMEGEDPKESGSTDEGQERAQEAFETAEPQEADNSAEPEREPAEDVRLADESGDLEASGDPDERAKSNRLGESGEADEDLGAGQIEVIGAYLSNGYGNRYDPRGNGSLADSFSPMARGDSEAADTDQEINSRQFHAPAHLESTGMELVGSSTSKKYHLPHCRYAIKIKEKNRIYFLDGEDAERRGYLPCKSCQP